jgi:hypothetical protein
MLGLLLSIAIAVTATNIMLCSPPSSYWIITTHAANCWTTEKITVIAQVLGGILESSRYKDMLT